MIVKMMHLDLVCVQGEAEETLEKLRELGAVHLDLASAKGAEVATAKGEAAEAERAYRAILKSREGVDWADSLTKQPCTIEGVLELEKVREEAVARLEEIAKEIKRYEPFGNFDPKLAKLLEKEGLNLKLKGDGTFEIAWANEAEEAEKPATQEETLLPLPDRSLAEMREEAARYESERLKAVSKLAASEEDSILSAFPALADKVAFAAAKELMSQEGEIAFISGWVPMTKVASAREKAAENGWGVLLRDPAADETPPTLVEPPKFFRPVKALFDGLGISPAYTEADVSVPFMCYFSLFFAMLVGDGAYGMIFLIGTIFGWKKYLAAKKANPVAKSWLILLSVFSLATVGWGVLSNTWFGANIPACANWPTVKWLADASYHNMMLLCFTIGASHLVLARLWNAVCKAPDSTALAELGWAGVLVMMYLVTNSIVGIFSAVPSWGIWVGVVSIALVFLFSVNPSELKTRGAELGMLPLNIMSALGDIISYVRLFAVGLASVKVAENFNSMATGLVTGADAIWAKALMSIAMVAILVVGHGLNLAMAGLSILVHAVRLNTLEFSNHKGVSWAGYAFKPFKKTSN